MEHDILLGIIKCYCVHFLPIHMNLLNMEHDILLGIIKCYCVFFVHLCIDIKILVY